MATDDLVLAQARMRRRRGAEAMPLPGARRPAGRGAGLGKASASIRYSLRSWSMIVALGLLLSLSAIARRLELPIQPPLGRLCAGCLRAAGGLYLKLGQFLANRTDLFHPQFLGPFAALQDRVSAMDLAEALSALPPAVGQSLQGGYDCRHARLIGSGSVAQVFAGRCRTSQRAVAIKVVRQPSRRLMLRDAAALRAVARRLSRLAPFRRWPLIAAVRICVRPICLQFNMHREAAIQRRFRARCTIAGEIATPEPIAVLHPHLLVMERVDGLRKLVDRPPGWAEALDRALDLLFTLLFAEHLLHCDLHPGNLFVGAEGDLVVIDHGLSCAIRPSDGHALARFFMALISFDPKAAAQICIETGSAAAGGADVAGLEADVEALFGDASRASAGAFNLQSFAASLIRIQARRGLISTPAFTLPVMALSAFEGQLKQIDPDADFQRAALGAVVRALSLAEAA
ncbi:MAG TPA: AarF/UbiB family protein [Allosphingosinicella sp.]|nr:AarF/UbiB family protein [Allosphingosinicella sp.]